MTLSDFVIPSVLAQHPVVEKVGWVLLHFLWEGALVAGVLALVLFLLRRRSSAERYVVSLAALAVMAVMPLVTWQMLPPAASPGAPAASSHAVQISASSATRTEVRIGGLGGVVVQVAPSAGAATQFPQAEAAPQSYGETGPLLALVAWGSRWARQSAPLVALAWLVGVVVLALRTAGGWGYLLSIKRDATPAAERWERRFQRLVHEMGGVGSPRAPQLLVSGRVEGPAAVGWWRPVVLVPTGFLTGLPPEQVEAVLRHELAHIRRHDYLVGLAQTVIETLLFYHPAVWWVSGRVRTLREHCCDDEAVRAGTSGATYARALAALEDWRSTASRPSGRKAAWGERMAPAASDGSLLARIRRIVGKESGTQRGMGWPAVVGVSTLLVLGACATGATAQREAPERETAQTTEESSARAKAQPLDSSARHQRPAPPAPAAIDEPPAPSPPAASADTIPRRDGAAVRIDSLEGMGALDEADAKAWQAWAEDQEAWAERWEAWGERWSEHVENEMDGRNGWAQEWQRWADSLRAAFPERSEVPGHPENAFRNAPRIPEPPSFPEELFEDAPPVPHSAPAPPPAIVDSLIARAWPHEGDFPDAFARFFSDEAAKHDTIRHTIRRAHEAERRALEQAAERLEARAEALEEEGHPQAARALRREVHRLRKQHERQRQTHERERIEAQQRERRHEAQEQRREALREQANDLRERAEERQEEAEDLRSRIEALREEGASATRVEALRRRAQALEREVLTLRQQSRKLRRQAGQLERGERLQDI